jgi:hypothetical protein
VSWTRVQGSGASNASGPTSNTTVSLTGVTAGDLVVVRATAYANSGVSAGPSISDSASNSYTLDKSNNTDTSYWAIIGHSVVTTGGSLTFKISWSSGTAYASIAVDEYSFSGSLSVDSVASMGYASTNSPQTGALTVTGNDLICAVLGLDSSATVTAGSGFTLRYDGSYSNGNCEGLAAEDELNVTSGLTPSWSLNTAIHCYAAAVAYSVATQTSGLSYWRRATLRASERPLPAAAQGFLCG